jgi:Malectin domain
MQCVETTHATYMFHHAAFISGNFQVSRAVEGERNDFDPAETRLTVASTLQGEELNRARRAHARMGYNFEVSNVAVSQSSSAGRVVVDVTVKQVGVAPFYYPLSLALNCQGTSATLTGVETLIESGATKVFSFASVPADSTCLSSVRLSLESSMAYTGKPIKFAQGNGSVVLNLPLPSGTSPGPAPAPASTFFVDARSHTGPRFTLTSTTLTTMPNAVAGTSNYQGDLFRHHRWHKGGFTYTISGFAAGASYAVTLGFAEIWEPNCAKGKRIFEVLANGSLIVSNLDVFAVAGCKKAYTTTKTVAANASGKIELKFVAVAENPFVSFIDVKAA